MGDDPEGGDSFFKRPVRRIRFEDEGYPPTHRQRRTAAPSDAELEQIIHDMDHPVGYRHPRARRQHPQAQPQAQQQPDSPPEMNYPSPGSPAAAAPAAEPEGPDGEYIDVPDYSDDENFMGEPDDGPFTEYRPPRTKRIFVPRVSPQQEDAHPLPGPNYFGEQVPLIDRLTDPIRFDYYIGMFKPLVEALEENHCFNEGVIPPFDGLAGIAFNFRAYVNAIRDRNSSLFKLYEFYTVRDGTRLASIVHKQTDDGVDHIALAIPKTTDGVYNLKVSLFFYFLDELLERCEELNNHNAPEGTFRVYCTDLSSGKQEIAANTINIWMYDTDPWGGHGYACSLSWLLQVYNDTVGCIIGHQAAAALGAGYQGGLLGVIYPHEESYESGQCILLGWLYASGSSLARNTYVYIELSLRPVVDAPVATRYTPQIGEALEKMFPERGIKVCDNADDYCFGYTVVMGMIWINRRNGSFTRGTIVESLEHVSAMALAGMGGAWAKEFLTGLLAHSHPLCKFIEERAGKTFNLSSFYKIMKEMEDLTLTPLNNTQPPSIAVDVFIVKPGHHVYPGYISHREATDGRLPLFAVYTDEISHFGLITKGGKFWNKMKGKQFFTCTKCKESFFSRSLLANHNCEPNEDGFHWSRRDCDDAVDVCHGCCQLCHLKFADEFSYEFHKENCFMKGRTGFKYIELSDETVLKGVEDTRVNLPEDHLYFADFECYFGEEARHEFMSYGLYNDEHYGYGYGYSIEDFIDTLEEEANKYKRIKVIFHNAMNYDATFVLRYVLHNKPTWNVQVIMKSCNKLQKLSFSWKVGRASHSIDIGDSFLFFPMSLERICECMKKPTLDANVEAFPRFFHSFTFAYPVNNEEASIILKKNLFPYRFFTSAEKLDTPMSEFEEIFEPREENLKYFGETVTVDKLAQNVGEFKRVVSLFQCRNARAYHDLYLRCDVLELADIYCTMRDTLWETHHINIAEYMGTPSATWAAFLRCDPELELALYDDTIYAEFFHRMMRGGVTSAPLRYARSDDTHSIIYLDVNGLYPYVMQKFPYPCGEFRWIKYDKSFGDASSNHGAMEELKSQLASVGRGFCAMVDLTIPSEIKELTDQYPFAPEHRVIHDQYYTEDGELYPFLKRWSEANPDSAMIPFRGLVGTLYPKKRYCLHGDVLLWYLRHGAPLDYIHNVITFKQSFFLRKYISKNIAMRNEATDEYRKMLLKLMNNSIYGKTCENPLNHSKFVILRNRDGLDGLVETSSVQSITPIDKDNFIVQITGEHITLDKTTYVGACVTDFAKLHMYELFYDKLSSLFEEVQLVYTDTDSFIVRVKHEAGKTLKEILEYMNSNGETLIGKEGGLLKSETGDDRIEEVIALRSKVYAYKTQKGKYGQRAKGTTASAQEMQLNWEVYKSVLERLVNKKTKNMMFAREHMEIRSVEVEKCSLSPNDGKRYICDDGIHTHAFGYF